MCIVLYIRPLFLHPETNKKKDCAVLNVIGESYTWPDSVSTCDTFLERGIVRASAGNNLMLTLYR
ncbi:hypothetical protein CRENBAI_002553 [Crenichthys baileyi]|uniref:Uncharacterized protein n=1 Tax=Crenichthys baileyi TaxID=28760 RepID=A0AAV9S8G3_9TELE